MVRCCRWWSFPPDFAGNTPAAGGHSFTYCPNMVRNVPNFASFQSFAQLLPPDFAKFSVFAGFGCPRSAPAAVCRMVTAWRPGVAVCPLLGREHRPPGDSPSLPSPPLFSLGHCLRLVVSVLLWCSPASGVPLGFLVLVSSLLGMVVYGGIFFFIQPRPE